MVSIFLSYARGDDESFVKRLYGDLKTRGFDVWFDRVSMPSRDLSFFREIQEAIAASDRLVLVVGPAAVESDYVTEEWRFAVDTGKAVNPVLRLGDYDTIPKELSFYDAPDFRDDANYQTALETLLRQISEPPAPLGKLEGVPDLPPHFIRNRERIAALKESMTADFERKTVITGVHGMGGIGKSVLANALARDYQVRRMFPDGIYWVTVGQNPDLTSLQAGLAKRLGEEAAFQNVEQGQWRLRKLLEDKAALVVLDDVWQQDHAQAFDVLGPRCRAILTTRDASLVSGLGGVDYQVQLMSDAEARHLLAEWAGCEECDLPVPASDVINECGRLPIAISICGAMVRDGTSWSDVAEALKEADLYFIDHPMKNYPHTSVFKSIKIGVDALSETERARLVELCAFRQDAVISESAIETLWAHTGSLAPRNGRKLLTDLSRKSLVGLQAGREEGQPRLATMHDLIHDYLVGLADDPKQLQETLLCAYAVKCPDGWHSGPNDGYFFENLCRHLIDLERWDDLESVLTDLDFVDAKSRAGLVYNLVSDYNSALEALPEMQEEHRKEEERRKQIDAYVAKLIAHSSNPDENSLPEPPQTVEIQPSRPASERTGDWTRVEKLNAWAHFVGTHSRRLADGEEPVFQIAWNSYDSGPVAERLAEMDAQGKGLTVKWLKLRNRPEFVLNPACMKTLEGHTSSVNAVSITPDGRRAVSGSHDHTLRLWNLNSGQCLKTLERHTSYLTTVSITSDGRRAVSGSDDNTIRIWDLEIGECLKTLEGHTSRVSAVSVTPNGRRAVSASCDKTLRLWDLETGQCTKTMEGHTDYVNAVSIALDGRRAVSGSYDTTLRLWDLERGQCLKVMEGHMFPVNAVSITTDGRRAVSGSWDTTLRLWDLETGVCLKTLEGHTSWVNAVSISSNGHRAVSGSYDTTLRLWDLETGRCLKTLEGHTGSVTAVPITIDGRRVVSASEDMTIRLWDIEMGQCQRNGHTGSVTAVSVTPDGRRAVSGSEDKTLRLWDLEIGECLKVLDGHTGSVTAVSITPDGRRAVSGSEDKTLRLWDLETGECLKTWEEYTNYVQSVSITPDGRQAVAGSGSILCLWDLETGQYLKTLDGHTSWVNAVSITPDGLRAVSGSEDKTLRFWDLQTGQCLNVLEGHTGWVKAVSITPDGRRAVSGSEDNTLRVWDLETDQCFNLCGTEAPVYSVVINLHTLVAGLRSGKVHIFTIENYNPGTPIATAVRLWLFDRQAWDSDLSALCCWCGNRFTVLDDWIGREITCPIDGCGKPLKLNPFVCDNSGWLD